MPAGGRRTGARMQVISQGRVRGAGRRGRAAGGGLAAGAAALLLVGVSHQALAQSAAPGTAVVLEPIVVSAGAVEGSTLSQRLTVLPGGVALVEREEMAPSANLTASRALSMVPGVVVQDFFGGNDQPRIQVRGSGLQQNPVERGILMLQDGLPLNRADGSYIVGFMNPNTAGALEVYRGYMANRLGANVLGGAVNMVSPTGSGQPGIRLRAAGGSFGQTGASAEAGFQGDGYDVHLHGDFSRRDGFRVYNGSQRVNVGGNVGIELSDTVKTRLFFGYTDLGFDVAGPLPKAHLNADPGQVHRGPVVTPGPSGPVATFPGPNVVRDKPRREASQFLIGSRTTAEFDAHLIDVVLGYTYTDDMFRFPVSSGIRVTSGGDFTGVARYAYQPDAAAALPLFEATAQYTVGSADRENYHNLDGAQGPMFGRSELDATSLSLNAGFNVPLGESFIVSPSIAYSHATRDNRDVFSSLTRPTVAYNPANPTTRTPNGAVPARSSSYERTYSGWSPSLGVSWRPDESQTLFGAVSRTFEPPTHDDLLATVNGTPNSGPGRSNPGNPLLDAEAFHTPDLKAQTATTVEAGWRGSRGGYAWDATVYYSWVDNELLNLRDVTGASLGAINAGKTSHLGVELGLTAQLTDQWSGRVAYTFQDFRFRDHAIYGDNRLAGAPRHVVNAVLQYDATENWMLQGAVRWLPARTPVDNANTLHANPYAVVDLRTQYRVNEHVSFFAEVTNVFDETYAASTLVVDQARPDQAAFIPGDGRGFFLGVSARF